MPFALPRTDLGDAAGEKDDERAPKCLDPLPMIFDIRASRRFRIARRPGIQSTFIVLPLGNIRSGDERIREQAEVNRNSYLTRLDRGRFVDM